MDLKMKFGSLQIKAKVSESSEQSEAETKLFDQRDEDQRDTTLKSPNHKTPLKTKVRHEQCEQCQPAAVADAGLLLQKSSNAR